MNETTTAPLPAREDLLRWNAETGRLQSRRYRVEIVGGPNQGHAVALDRCMRVGTHTDAELRVVDETVSRIHVELTPRSDGVRVRDLGSRNGTYLSGARVNDVILEVEGTLTIGMTRLRVCVEDGDIEQPDEVSRFGGVLGGSPPMRSLLGLLRRVAQSDATVLLQGETGTGKEVLAHAVHSGSSRADGPFVVIDCSGIPAELSESELFGHVKGAFTGAQTSRRGAFVDADGGTVFLDEIGELPLDLQPRLLRVLETGAVRAVGSDVTRTVDVRVVAATHRNLHKEVEEGRFRQDLFFRLSVITLTVPPLRERLEDLPLLVSHFADAVRVADTSFGPNFMAALRRHTWRGNVRELRNVVERALLLHGGACAIEALSAPELDDLIANTSPEERAEPFHPRRQTRADELPPDESDARAADSKARIVDALAQCGGNQSLAAKRLGISRGTLIARIRAFGIPRPRKPDQ